MNKIPMLALEDFSDLGDSAVREKIISDFELKPTDLDNLDIIVAYMSVGSWGCDSSAWFLFRARDSRQLFEVSGSHCSCYGFEGQFTLEATTLGYLHSENFSFSCGGYDSDSDRNEAKVRAHIKLVLDIVEPS